MVKKGHNVKQTVRHIMPEFAGGIKPKKKKNEREEPMLKSVLFEFLSLPSSVSARFSLENTRNNAKTTLGKPVKMS